MNQYECYLCKNQDDCIEVKSQAVRDVSIRCGLTCHSDFQSERDKVLDDLYRFAKENRCGWGFVDGVDAYRTELRQAGSP